MKRIIYFVLIAISVSILLNINAEEGITIPAGSKLSEINTSHLESSGYKIVDNSSGDFSYAWPYNLGWTAASEIAYGGNALHNAGQVSGQITYDFSGTYIAVAFCETYYAAKILIYIDDVLSGEYTPHINDKAMAEKAGESRIIYVNAELSEGEHTLEVKHEAAHTSGEDNVKGDGKAYYDNDAYFDYVIVKNETEAEPVKIELGAKINRYTDDVLDKLGYKAIYSSNEDIVYTWPYDLESAKVNSKNRALRFNLGQVGAELSCDFEGSFLAVVLAECYYAAKVILDVDGEVIGEVTPHTKKVKVSDIPYQSKILIIKEDLGGGSHTLTITLEAAHTTGEDNIKGDGKAYYDNDAFFDCIIVQKNPDEKEVTPTPEQTATPVPEVTATPVKTENPATGDNSKISTIALLSAILIIGIIVTLIIIIKRKRDEKV